jgi:hypothetical protein
MTAVCTDGACVYPTANEGLPCDNGKACVTATCQGGSCVDGSNVTDGTPCGGAGNLCTATCSGGTCTGGAVSCPGAPDQCHGPATCASGTGTCGAPPPLSNTGCDDGNMCTTGDMCQAGVCTGGSSVTCTAPDLCHTVGACVPASGCPAPVAIACAPPDACHMAGSCDAGTGQCTYPKMTDGTGCDDGNKCNGIETCQNGVCSAGTAVVCAAKDGCHMAGTCDPPTGMCSDPTAPDGTSCDDGNKCNGIETCASGTCTTGTGVTCTAKDRCHGVGTCSPSTGVCSDPPLGDGTSCDDGNKCNGIETCQSGTCAAGTGVTCTAKDRCHGVGTCEPTTGVCSDPNLPDGTGCDATSGCQGARACMSGVCTTGAPVSCPAQDKCHGPGVCDTTTGVCSKPKLPDGTNCDDGDLCNGLEKCQDGTCTAGTPVVCKAKDACHFVGTCVPATGKCMDPPFPDGHDCDDGDRCNGVELCQSGECVAGTAVVCKPLDRCHGVGACQPMSGLCTSPPLPDGTSCTDDNKCTGTSACNAGVCTSGAPVGCPAQDKCHGPGTCDQVTGLCTNPPLPDDTSCDDGNKCNGVEKCSGGVCVNGAPVTCKAPDRCHGPGRCDPATGMCSNPALPDGTSCNDGNTCNGTSACSAGMCKTDVAVGCPAQDKCHGPGVCDAMTGTCSTPALPDGTNCDDGNKCNGVETCRNGKCTNSPPVVCTAPDTCHSGGTCDPATGMCSNPPVPDGTGCSATNRCDINMACKKGVCTTGATVSCPAQDKCHGAGTCNATTGACSNPMLPDDSDCDDGDKCNGADRCKGGICESRAAMVCPPPDACHTGACNRTTGACEFTVIDSAACAHLVPDAGAGDAGRHDGPSNDGPSNDGPGEGDAHASDASARDGQAGDGKPLVGVEIGPCSYGGNARGAGTLMFVALLMLVRRRTRR